MSTEETMTSGMLPYTKSIKNGIDERDLGFDSVNEAYSAFIELQGLEKSHFDEVFEESGGFELPGHGLSRSGCGEFWTKGCLEVDLHKQDLIGVKRSGLAFVKKVMNSCLRSVCPVCYEKWCGKEAHKIEYRLLEGKRSYHGRVIHVTVSVPISDYEVIVEDFSRVRSKVYKFLKRVGVFGGACIYHPFRSRVDKTWYFSPHFHVLGYGWLRGKKVKSLNRSTGYVVVNLGVRKSVGATAVYQLSHCGVKKGLHAVTWFGDFSYNKCKVKKEVREEEVCPICGGVLRPLLWVGKGDDVLVDCGEGEFYVDGDGWVYTSRYRVYYG